MVSDDTMDRLKQLMDAVRSCRSRRYALVVELGQADTELKEMEAALEAALREAVPSPFGGFGEDDMLDALANARSPIGSSADASSSVDDKQSQVGFGEFRDDDPPGKNPPRDNALPPSLGHVSAQPAAPADAVPADQPTATARRGRPIAQSTLALIRYVAGHPRPDYGEMAKVIAGRDDRRARNKAGMRLRNLEAAGRIRLGPDGWQVVDPQILRAALSAATIAAEVTKTKKAARKK